MVWPMAPNCGTLMRHFLLELTQLLVAGNDFCQRPETRKPERNLCDIPLSRKYLQMRSREHSAYWVNKETTRYILILFVLLGFFDLFFGSIALTRLCATIVCSVISLPETVPDMQ